MYLLQSPYRSSTTYCNDQTNILQVYRALPPLLQRIAWELHVHKQTSLEIVIPLLLGTAAFGCQGLVNVTVPDGRASPIALFVTLIARPGTGKSTVLTRLLKPTYSAEKKLNAEAQLAIEIAGSTGKDEAKFRQFLFGDVTAEALASDMQTFGASALIAEEEAVSFLEGKLGRAFPLLSKLWDGRLSRVARISRARNTIDHARLGKVLALQPGPWQRYVQRHGQRAIESGYFSRVLISESREQPVPRYLPVQIHAQPEMALNENDARMEALLLASASSSDDIANLPELRMSPRGVVQWNSMAHRFEVMAQQEAAVQLQPHLQRFPQMVARIAAVLHLFEGLDGEISAETIEQATIIAQYFLCEARRLLIPPPEVPQAWADAQEIEFLLLRQPQRQMAKSELVAHARTFDVSKARVEKAVQTLVIAGRVRHPRDCGSVIVQLMTYPVFSG